MIEPADSPGPDAPRRRVLWWVVAVVAVQVMIVVVALTVPASPTEVYRGTGPAGLIPVTEPPVAAEPTRAEFDRLVTNYLDDNPRLRAAVAIDTGDRVLRYGADERFETASTVKLEILVRWLLLRQDEPLPADETELARAMIVSSDNAATDTLCAIIAPWTPPDAVPGGTGACAADGLWGTDLTDVDGLVQVLDTAFRPGLLTDDSRALVRELTGSVVPGQAWGVTEAAGPDEPVWLKNGWDARDGGWIAHSVGRVGDVDIVVLTDGSPDYETAVRHVVALCTRIGDLLHP